MCLLNGLTHLNLNIFWIGVGMYVRLTSVSGAWGGNVKDTLHGGMTVDRPGRSQCTK